MMKRIAVELSNGKITTHKGENIYYMTEDTGFIHVRDRVKPTTGGSRDILLASYNPAFIVRIWGR